MAKRGRPPKAINSIDRQELEDLMRFYPSEEECADWFDVSVSTLQRFINREFKCNFDQLRNKKFVRTKIGIKRVQIEKALKGDNTMLIWVGKNLLGQSESPQALDDLAEAYERPMTMRQEEE